MPEIVNQKVGFGKRLVLLCNGESVQGEPARQGHRELIQLREVREEGGRGEGVGKHEQEGVAGVVLIIIRSGVGAEGPHCKAAEILTLNLTPHRTFEVTSVSPAVLIPFATPCLSGATGATSTSRPSADAPGPAAAARGSDRAGTRAALAALRGSTRPATEGGEPEQW